MVKVVDVYFRSLTLPRDDNQTKYDNPAKLLFNINANLAAFKITIGGIRDLKYTLIEKKTRLSDEQIINPYIQ